MSAAEGSEDEEEERLDPCVLVSDFYAACKAGDSKQAKELQEYEVPPFYSDGNWTPLHYAAAGGDLDVVDTLIRAGADPRSIDYSGWTPMVVALANGNIPAANVLKKWQSLPGIVSVNHDGQMNFDVIGVAGTQCDIEASVDLKKWSRIGQVSLKNGRGSFLDARRIWLPRCFYRAKAVE